MDLDPSSGVKRSLEDEGRCMKNEKVQHVMDSQPQSIYSTLKTGVCYDVRMRYHAKIYTSYTEYIDPHPEDPRRIYRIYKILAENGLIQDPTLSGIDAIGDLMSKISVREATDEEILEVHTKEQLAFLGKTESLNRDQLLKETEQGDSVYFNNDTFLSAKLSCGGAIEACKAVVEKKVKNALAIVRPPGHHSEPEVAGGFCLFSNVAVAAKNILRNYPDKVKKIMILDWDIHHGNGTQKVFYENDSVLYVSLHRFDLGKYYPGTIHGQYDQVGEGKGKGFNCNITWPVGGVGDVEYMWAFEQVVMPMAREFEPDLVIVSSGFDAADGDTIGQCHVTPSCYGHMTYMLKSLANGNICVILEGGYNLDSIARSALAVTKVLIGEPPEELPTSDRDIKPEVIDMIDKIIAANAPYWKCFQNTVVNSVCDFKDPITQDVLAKRFPLQKAIRSYQISQLAKQYNMCYFPTIYDNESQNTILCSQSIFDYESIVIIIHDTPQIWANLDVKLKMIDNSGALITDNTVRFIDWCYEHDFGVIDMEVPQSFFEQDNFSSSLAAQETLIKLWDNQLKYFSNTSKIAFIGIGDALSSIVHLLGHRDTRATVKSVVGFVGNNTLKPLVPLVEESLSDWFFRNSLLFSNKNHACWGDNDNKKPRKRFGRVMRCESDGLFNNIDERFDEAINFILDSFEEQQITS